MQLSSISLAISRLGGGAFGAGAALALDFLNGNNTLDPRVTLSRTSNATLTNSAGVLTYAPHNLLTFSEQFDNSAWTKSAATVSANALAAPNGTTTADVIRADATSAEHFCDQAFTTIAGNTYTVSVSVKANGLTDVGLRLTVGSLWTGSVSPQVRFNLLDGTTTTIVGTPSASSITALGDGWYRVSMSAVCISGGSPSARIHLMSGNNNVFTGNGTNGISAWGAQLNVGALQPYYPTTVKNLLGYTQEFDNAAWTKSNSFVQTNQIRNNTMQGAVAGTPGTLPTNWSIGGQGTLSQEIVGSGIENGINYVDVRLFGTASTGSVGVRFEGTTAIPATAGQVWTGSLYASLIAGTLSSIPTVGVNITGLTAGGAGTSDAATSNFTASIANPNFAENRTTISRTLSDATTAFLRVQFLLGLTSGGAVNATFRIGLPQLVQGASAGDVVATYGTARAVMYAAPDGSVTADKLVENTATGEHAINQAFSFVTGGVYTQSVYAKAGERTLVRVGAGNPATWASGAVFDLSSGTITSTVVGSASIVAVGDGWYRLSVTGSALATAPTGVAIRLVSNGATINYTGDGTSGIYIWGAQISDSASLDPYVYNPVAAPASTAYYGPRFDYDPVTLAPKGLLVEEQRTNLSSNSVLASAWGAPSAASYTDTQALAPDGTNSAWRLTEDTTNAAHFGSMTSISTTYTSGTTYTVSRFLKAAGRTQVTVYLPGGAFPTSGRTAFFDLSSGTIVSTEAGVTASIQNVGNGWYRCTTTATANASVIAHVGGSALNGGIAYQGDGTSGVFIWGHQLEAGSFPTSYIPTTTAAATRAADVATMIGANFSNWYNQTEGTLFGDASVMSAAYASGVFLDVGAGGAFGTTAYLSWFGTGWALNPAAAPVNMFSTVTGTPSAKIAAALASNNAVIAASGLIGSVDASCAMPVSATTLSIGKGGWSGAANYFNGTIKRIAYYNRRLSNSELQAITS